MRRNSFTGWLLLSAWAAGVASLYAQSPSSTDWNQWRGPNHDGTIAPGDVPAVWPSAFTRLWSVELGEGYSSPVLAGGNLIVQAGSDVKGGLVAALDPATGATRWDWRGDGPGYATPLPIDPQGTPQLVVTTNKAIVGLDAATGKALWSTPFADE